MTTTKPPVSMLDLLGTGEMPITSTDTTAAAGPVFSLYRDSASPAASDLIGYQKFDGRDSAGNRQNYASILAQIVDPTTTSEDGALFFSTCVASVDTVTMTVLGGKVGIGNSAPLAKLHVGGGSEAPVSPGNAPSLLVSENAALTAVIRDDLHDTQLTFGAQSGSTYQDTQGADFVKHFFQINGQTLGFMYDQPTPGSGAGLIIGAAGYVFNNPQTIGIQMHSNPYVADVGGTLPTGTIVSTIGNYAGGNLALNRSTGDGELVAFYSAGSFIGNITCSGGTVSYNAFSGSHWSQLTDQKRMEILPGTIVDTIDEMCSWEGEEPDFHEHLPKFRISADAGSRSVYGVFTAWMHKGKAQGWGGTEEFVEDDALITSLGAASVRIDPSETVKRGDLIESAGNGCGRVQADDIFRTSTVAKVTAAIKIETYEDGSYLVPCTLHCG